MDYEEVDPLSLRIAARSGKKSVNRLSSLIRASLTLVWSSGRGLLVALTALQFASAVALAGQVLAVQLVLAAVLGAAGSGQVAGVLGPVLLLAVLTAVSAVTGSVTGQFQRLLGETVARAMWTRVLGVATGVGLRHFEAPEFYNRLNRVQTSAMTRPYAVTQGLLTLVGAFVASVSLAVTLFSLAPILLPLVIIGGIPVLLTSRRESRLEFDFAVKQTPLLRLRAYFTQLQTGRDEAKEVRAFGLAGWLHERFDRVYVEYLDNLRHHVKRRAVFSLIGQLGSAIVLGATLLVLVWLIGQGQLGVAEAGAAIVAIRMLASQVQQIFQGVQSIFEAGLFLDDLNDFLALGRTAQEADTGVEAPDSFGTLRVESVGFRYPGSDAEALHAVNLEIREGEVVALVGENGSGKTTLAKLIAGLYYPDDGRITWDGNDTARFRPSSLRDQITLVFQDFVRYALTGTENISIGRVARPVDADAVLAAAGAAGAADILSALPRGFDTILSRLFAGGRDLSGGEWQRVALARSFYRDAPLVILDEPSASLDPRAEHELFSTLRSALHGRTALFISHRFSTVRGADRIYVLHRGAVVEEGTHEELMAADHRYAELYRLQSDAYVSRIGADPAEDGHPG